MSQSTSNSVADRKCWGRTIASMQMLRTIPLLLVLTPGFGACRRTPTDASRVFSLPITGTVTNTSGDPVGSAVVLLTSVGEIGVPRDTVGACVGIRNTTRQTTTASDGTFSVQLVAGGVPQRVCLDATVTPPPGIGLTVVHVAKDSVLIGPAGIGDSVVVLQIVLPNGQS